MIALQVGLTSCALLAWLVLATSLILQGCLRKVLHLGKMREELARWRARQAARKIESIPEFNLSLLGTSTRVKSDDLRHVGPTLLFVNSQMTEWEVSAESVRLSVVAFRARPGPLYIVCSGNEAQCAELQNTTLQGLDNLRILVDWDGSVSNTLDVDETPAAFVFDNDGRLTKSGIALEGRRAGGLK
jgi:hypothetical protein